MEKWDIFELEVKGKMNGNPFLDYTIQGCFVNDNENVTVSGFYDGDGVYKVRFMPSYEGTYTYRIFGSYSDEIREGSFEVTTPGPNNHGPVTVINRKHLSYMDKTPYNSIGTTCYAWVNQSMERQEQTLETLSTSPFNKIRFCFFPKYYEYNRQAPLSYPFERGKGEGIDPKLIEKDKRYRVTYPGQEPLAWDLNFNYFRPNVEHFRRFDLRIGQLRDMGIEADLILMHPYDRWGMNLMSQSCCDAYLRYIVARYGAFRNVWWSLSNEYDLIPTRDEADWEHFGMLIHSVDCYGHMCSIHNGAKFYDYKRPWITHCSMQRIDIYRHVEYTDEYMSFYGKPVLWDEIGYEGNLSAGWGNLTPQELVRRFWETVLRGGHAGHGETYLAADDILWWSHGGTLKGKCMARLSFLQTIINDVPGKCLRRGHGWFDEVVGVPVNEEDPSEGMGGYDYELHYLGISQPAVRDLFLPSDKFYEVEAIDTWNMTITFLGRYRGKTMISLPQKQYMAIRIKRCDKE